MALRGLPLAQAFVELADTTRDDFDVAHHLHILACHLVDILDVDAAGVMLADQRGDLRLIATSSEHQDLVELMELQGHEGPSLESFRKGEPFFSVNMRWVDPRWPGFAKAAHQAGFSSAMALPLRLRADIAGSACALRREPGTLDTDQLATAQALVDLATIALLHQRARHQQDVLASQLQTALNSRIIIEQAKGVLAERHQLFMDQAFAELRGFARSHHRRLTEVAHAVVRNQPDVVALARPRSAHEVR